MKTTPHIAVIGAGAFGGWTALHLLEAGARVTLLDAWGPGNSRSSSGGETRVMRGTYGPDQPYTEMAARSLALWAKYERRWKRQFLHRSGVLWMAAGRDDTFERGSVKMLKAANVPFRELSTAHMKRRWPQINFEGIEWGIFEPQCGYLEARASCQAVMDAFLSAGGKYKQVTVASNELEDTPLRRLRLSDRSQFKTDICVFACGPWMGKLFPQTVGDLVKATKQDVFFFGPPAGDNRFGDEQLPVWADHRGHFRYGIPGSDRRGFKIADDTRGPEFDPDCGERLVSPDNLKDVRDYVAFRFPALKSAPLIETRVCQYEQTPDSGFIVDRHPKNDNVWLLGGGSGHGFKHGPAIGELVARLVLRDRTPDALWSLDRFQSNSQQGFTGKHRGKSL
jgi:sarcosine oxidase